ncbi:Myc-type, basic helix-loop-helix (bHLH) domain [Phytophthora cactorum]|nr:Myc-type, basic helix-loop-helix (bHLH) domain [Phytophthora cactorum]
MATGADTFPTRSSVLWPALNDEELPVASSTLLTHVTSTSTPSTTHQRLLLPSTSNAQLNELAALLTSTAATSGAPQTFLDDLLRDDGDTQHQTQTQSFQLLQGHEDVAVSSAMTDVGEAHTTTTYSSSSSSGSPSAATNPSRLLQLETNYERKKKRAKINRKDLNSRFQELMDILHLKEDRKLNRAKILEKTIEHIEKLTAQLNALKARQPPPQQGLQHNASLRKKTIPLHHPHQLHAAMGQHNIAGSVRGSAAGGAPLLPYNPSQSHPWSAGVIGTNLPLAPVMWMPCPVVTSTAMTRKRAAPGRTADTSSRKRGRVESVEKVTAATSAVATESSVFEWSAQEIPTILSYCDAWTLVSVMRRTKDISVWGLLSHRSNGHTTRTVLVNGKAAVMQVVELFVVVQNLSRARVRVTDGISVSASESGDTNSSFQPFTAASGAHLMPTVVAVNSEPCVTKDLAGVALHHGDLCVLSVFMACPGLEMEDQFLQRVGWLNMQVKMDSRDKVLERVECVNIRAACKDHNDTTEPKRRRY